MQPGTQPPTGPPTNPPLHEQPGARNPEWPPAGPGYAAPPSGVTVTKARPWLIGIVALVTMAVLIGALGNQKVSDTILRHNVDTTTFGGNFLRSLEIYGWRFSPIGHSDYGHFWLASIIFDGAVLVLTLLLTAAVMRGRGSFGHIFLCVWMSVVMATAVSSYARGIVIDSNQVAPQQGSKPVEIFFSTISANAYTVFVGLLFGFFTALVAAVVGVLTRRTEVVGAPYAPVYAGAHDVAAPGPRETGERPAAREAWSAPPAPGPVVTPSPWTGASESGPATEAAAEPVGERPGERPGTSESPAANETAVLPVADFPQRDESAATGLRRGSASDEGEQTTELPRTSAPDEGEHTTELPRPRDE